MVVYYLITLISCWFCQKYYNKKEISISKNRYKYNFYIIIVATILILVGGLRYGIGTDYFTYKNIFERIVKEKNNFVNWEIAFYWLCRIIGFFNGDYRIFFLICSFLSVIFVVLRIALDSKYPALSIMIYICSYFYFASFNIIRQTIAMGILFFGSRYLEKKQPFVFLLFLLLAFSFHKTALIGLLFYYIFYIKTDNIFNFLLLLLFPIIFIVFKDYIYKILELLYPSYFKNFRYEVKISIMRFLFEFVILFLCLLKFKSMKFTERNTDSLINMQILSIDFNLISFFIPFSDRIIMYFSFYQILLIPLLIKSIKLKSDKIIVSLFFVVYYIFYIFYSLYIQGSGEVLPYRWIFGV